MGPDAVYDDDRQHRIVLHKKAAGQAVEVSTEFINDSAEAVTLEMLSSFAIRGSTQTGYTGCSLFGVRKEN